MGSRNHGCAAARWVGINFLLGLNLLACSSERDAASTAGAPPADSPSPSAAGPTPGEEQTTTPPTPGAATPSGATNSEGVTIGARDPGDAPPPAATTPVSEETPVVDDRPAIGDVPEGPRPTVTPAEGAALVHVNPLVLHQTFEGWGTSMAWWAHQIGAWPDEPKNELIEQIVNPTTGLGFNIFRYNIGGGENPTHTHMGPNRDLPGFQPEPGVWNWDADVRQTSVLSRIVARGEGLILEAFSNSPPYWMTNSQCASGAADGTNNLREDSYGAFADYLSEVVLHYRDVLGITFRTVEPLNEPTAPWWYANGGQEGCHFDPDKQEQILGALSAELTAKGLTETQLSASDDNSMDDAYANLSGYAATTIAQIAQLNTHSYNGTQRKEMRALATSQGKRLWQSESGPLGVQIRDETDVAIFMAGRIIQDLRELEPNAWIDWQVIDNSRSWTSFAVNDAERTWVPLKRFYVQSGFSRYIRSGSTFADIDNADMVAAINADRSALTIVARNGDAMLERAFTFDLTALASVGSEVAVYRTSRSENLVTLPPLPIDNYSFSATLPPSSVTTYVITR